MWRVAIVTMLTLGAAGAQDTPQNPFEVILHPSFETALAPATPRLTSHASGIRSEAGEGARVVVHRWVHSGDLYSGYDLLLEVLAADPETGEQRMWVTFAPLSARAEDLFGEAARLVPLAAYPEGGPVKVGAEFTVDPVLAPQGGQRIVDHVTMSASAPVVLPTPEQERERRIASHVGLSQDWAGEGVALLRLLRQASAAVR